LTNLTDGILNMPHAVRKDPRAIPSSPPLGAALGSDLTLSEATGYVTRTPGSAASRPPRRQFGKSLEEVAAGRDRRVLDLRKALEPFRALVSERTCLSGDRPMYADYILGAFQ
jgi:hypothetical protein